MIKQKNNIAFITSNPENLKKYFPTLTEPDFIPIEPPFTPDDQIAVNFLRSKGFKVTAVEWGTNIDELKSFDMLIMRSTWDYVDSNDKITAFTSWLEELEQSGIKTENDAFFMKWLVDKSYLLDLEKSGVPVIPSKIVQSLDLTEAYRLNGDFVLKPCISNSGKNLFLIDSLSKAEKIQSEYDELSEQKKFLIQPFIKEILTNGEWSLTFIDSIYSHTAHKKPGNNSILVQTESGGSSNFIKPPSYIIEFAESYFQKIITNYNPLYLRLDIIETPDGLFLSECEGIEPELFFRADKTSLDLFYNGILKRLQLTNFSVSK